MPRPDPSPDDAELVRRYVAERAEDAFLTLYRRHTPRLYQTALRLQAWDEDEAREVLQEVWIRAASRLGDFHWRSSLATWLVAIAVNVSRELDRKRRRWPESLPETVTERWNALYPSRGDDRVDLERFLATLPEGLRQVLVLHDVEGFTHLEIGRLLDIETGTSKSQLSRARRRMREALTTDAVPARGGSDERHGS